VFAEPGQSTIYDLTSPAFYGFVSVRTSRPEAEPGIVGVKPAVKAGSHAAQGIKDERPHESRSVVSMLTQQVRQIWKTGREWNTKIVDMIKLRISSSEDRGVGCCGKRHLRVCAGENYSLLS
jgi:hypothetical protein